MALTGKGSTNPKPVIQEDILPLRESLGSYFENMLSNESGLSSPQGVIGPQWQALFGPDPSTDYLGARSAVERSLSPDAFRDVFSDIFSSMLPGAQRSIEQMSRGVLDRNTGLGLRFSSDVMNQQRRGAENILLGTQSQAAQQVLPFLGQQASTGLDLMGLIGQLGENQLMRQLPLLVQYAMAFAPVGQRGKTEGSGLDALTNLFSLFGGNNSTELGWGSESSTSDGSESDGSSSTDYWDDYDAGPGTSSTATIWV